MIPWRCRFGWHQWAKWTHIEKPGITFYTFNGLQCKADGIFDVQERTCQGCGRFERESNPR